jgi:hypothetical protein
MRLSRSARTIAHRIQDLEGTCFLEEIASWCPRAKLGNTKHRTHPPLIESIPVSMMYELRSRSAGGGCDRRSSSMRHRSPGWRFGEALKARHRSKIVLHIRRSAERYACRTANEKVMASGSHGNARCRYLAISECESKTEISLYKVFY